MNVISDYASAAVMIRVVADLEETKALALGALKGVEVEIAAATPPLRMEQLSKGSRPAW